MIVCLDDAEPTSRADPQIEPAARTGVPLAAAAMDLETLKQSGFCDVTLWGIRWDPEAPDVILSLQRPDGTKVELRCVFARDVCIALDKRQRLAGPEIVTGPALSWDGSVTAAADGTCELVFDFAGDGSISLKCDEVEVAIATS